MSEMDTRQLIARNLVRLLELAQMTQSDLADRLAVSKTAVSSWCSGAKAPRMDKIDAMAEIFHVQRSAFYADAGPEIVIRDGRGEQLQKIYYKLNEQGQSKLIEYAIDLSGNPAYQKKSPPTRAERSTNGWI